MSRAFRIVTVAALSVCVSAPSARADDIDKVLGSLAKSSSTTFLCRKGDLLHRVFSLRSFDGALCSQLYTAAFAEIMCGQDGDYEQSQCAGKAKETLGDKSPKDVLQEAVLKGAGKIKDLVCAASKKTTNALVRQIAAAGKC